MSDHAKELILKALLVADMILLPLFFPGSLLLLLFVEDAKTIELIVYTIFFSICGIGILFMVLLPIFGGLKQKPVKAQKFPLLFTSHDEFLCYLHTRLLENSYQNPITAPLSIGDITVYMKKSKTNTLDCFTVIRVPELSNELISDANERITDILTDHFGGKRITDTVNMISIFCVDRITPSFRTLINGNIQQGLKNGRLLVGISFGSKSIYVAQQKDGFAIAKYKKLRKRFSDIMNL